MKAGDSKMGDRNAYRNLERLNLLYAMLSRTNRTILRATDVYELYQDACRIAVEQGGLAFAWIGLVEPGGQRVALVAGAGAVGISQRKPFALPTNGNCPCHSVIRESSPAIVKGLSTSQCSACPARGGREAPFAAAAAFPLRLEDEVIGVFEVGADDADYFQEAEVLLLAEMAEDISFALETLRREEKRLVAESKVRYLASYDSQTGLPGATLFGERLAAICQAGGKRQVAVLVVNLRRYHGALQVLGTAAGVRLARVVVNRLESLLTTSAVGRITETEFAFMLDEVDGLHEVEETAWRIHAALAEGIPVEGSDVFLEPFIGIAVYPQDGAPADVLKAATTAAATGLLGAGGNSCRFFVAEMDAGSRRRLDLEAALRRAVDREEFALYYQPQLDLVSGRIVGAEALLRWRRPNHGVVAPQEFIPLLEENGLIVPVGEWVVREACRYAKACQDEGLMPFRIAVNLAARQFQDADVGALVRGALDATSLDPNWLELEITESSVLHNAETVIRTMNELKSCGVSQALDDFGTGYSSLSYLQRMPVARLKIDRSFIANLISSPNDAAIVRAVVGMAHSLGIAVIAEGVENEGQLGYLRGLGCEEIQGYYFSRPLPEEEFAAMLRDNRGLAPVMADKFNERVLLLVDDEANVLSALRRLLRRSEYRVLTASNPQEGFNLLAAYPVGVVVCDQRMPEMTGTEFLRRARELHPDTVRIVLSGYTDLGSVIDAVNRGAVYKFLTKPWEDDILLESLQDAFRLYEMGRENRELSRRVKELLAVDGMRT